MHAYIHIYIHTYIYTYIHTYIYTYIHTYIHTIFAIIFYVADFVVEMFYYKNMNFINYKRIIAFCSRNFNMSVTRYLNKQCRIHSMCHCRYTCGFHCRQFAGTHSHIDRWSHLCTGCQCNGGWRWSRSGEVRSPRLFVENK